MTNLLYPVVLLVNTVNGGFDFSKQPFGVMLMLPINGFVVAIPDR